MVEDEGEMRRMLVLELEVAGYEVFEAQDGEAGLRMAERVKPDLIIADVLMPNMDGNQMMKKLRASDFGRGIPFIVLTARGKMQDYFEVMEVDDFIEKPFERKDFLRRVQKAVEKPRMKTAPQKPVNKKILILDDDVLVYLRLQKTLFDEGYEVEVVNTVAQCLEDAILFKPDMIIVRFLLEGMNADHLTHIIKGMPHAKDIPVIVYSRDALNIEERSVLDAGAVCVVGNVNEEKILRAVERVFS